MSDHTDFQRAVTDAFLRVMKEKRPELLWSAKPGEVGKVIPDPDDGDTLTDRSTRTAA